MDVNPYEPPQNSGEPWTQTRAAIPVASKAIAIGLLVLFLAAAVASLFE